jgi:hypothetical protein
MNPSFGSSYFHGVLPVDEEILFVSMILVDQPSYAFSLVNSSDSTVLWQYQLDVLGASDNTEYIDATSALSQDRSEIFTFLIADSPGILHLVSQTLSDGLISRSMIKSPCIHDCYSLSQMSRNGHKFYVTVQPSTSSPTYLFSYNSEHHKLSD